MNFGVHDSGIATLLTGQEGKLTPASAEDAEPNNITYTIDDSPGKAIYTSARDCPGLHTSFSNDAILVRRGLVDSVYEYCLYEDHDSSGFANQTSLVKKYLPGYHSLLEDINSAKNELEASGFWDNLYDPQTELATFINSRREILQCARVNNMNLARMYIDSQHGSDYGYYEVLNRIRSVALFQTDVDYVQAVELMIGLKHLFGPDGSEKLEDPDAIYLRERQDTGIPRRIMHLPPEHHQLELCL